MYSKEAETFLLKEMQHLDFNSKNDEINLEQIIKRFVADSAVLAIWTKFTD